MGTSPVPSLTGGTQETAQRQLTFIIDLAVSVDVSLSDHFIHLLIGQLLT